LSSVTSKFHDSLLALTVFIIFLTDIFSKLWVHHNLPLMTQGFPDYPYGGIAVFKNFLGIEFSINYLTNRGAAWGVLADYQVYLLAFRIMLIVAMIVYFFRYNQNPSWKFPLSLIITGAIGNVIDYFAYGHVVDMLHFVLWGYDFPVFNIADSAVTIGIFWLLCVTTWQERQSKIHI
jgi:signal peptidase II